MDFIYNTFSVGLGSHYGGVKGKGPVYFHNYVKRLLRSRLKAWLFTYFLQ